MLKPTIILLLLTQFLYSCAAVINDKDVTLIRNDSKQYTGSIKYSDPYSGILSINNGPKGESFSGKFVVIDQTATSTSNGTIVVPNNSQIPAVGGITKSSSGVIKATGYWFGKSNKGTKIEGRMQIEIGGHGHGTCKDSDGNTYEIIF